MADVTTGRRVFLVNSCDLFGQEPVGQPRERGPQTPMNEGDLAADKAADEYFLGLRDQPQRGIDVLAFGMRPPASLDGLTHDGFDEARRASLGRRGDDTTFLYQCHGVSGGE